MNFEDSDSSGNESTDEIEEPGVPVVCLFCDNTQTTMDLSVEHIKTAHKFNIIGYLTKNVTNTYDLVKIVTYIRSKSLKPDSLESSGRQWDSEEFLKPVDSSDPWLWTDFEFIDHDGDDAEPKYVNSENGLITLAKQHFDELQQRNLDLNKLVEEKERYMEELRNLLNETEVVQQVAGLRPGDDNYFSSYSSYDIHREMLSDVPRMKAFRELFNERSLFEGKDVLDVGCGTGILSMMAASVGAKSVVGVDEADIVYTGVEIIIENKLENTVKLLKGNIETIELNGKFDVIVSEWLGYFLLFEGMLSSVLIARDRFLKPGGRVFPSVCSVNLAGVSDPEGSRRRLQCEIEGYTMTPLRNAALREAAIETVRPEHVATEAVTVHNIDVLTAEQSSCYFSTDFNLVANANCLITSICGWFVASFEPANSRLSTSPYEPQTHWQQTNFYLEKPFNVTEGDNIKGRISVEPTYEGARSLIVNITINDITQSFNIA